MFVKGSKKIGRSLQKGQTQERLKGSSRFSRNQIRLQSFFFYLILLTMKCPRMRKKCRNRQRNGKYIDSARPHWSAEKRSPLDTKQLVLLDKMHLEWTFRVPRSRIWSRLWLKLRYLTRLGWPWGGYCAHNTVLRFFAIRQHLSTALQETVVTIQSWEFKYLDSHLIIRIWELLRRVLIPLRDHNNPRWWLPQRILGKVPVYHLLFGICFK